MINRLFKTFVCSLIALAIGMTAYVAVRLAGNPQLLAWSRTEWLWSEAEAVAIFYLLVPLIVLALVAVFKRAPSTALSVLVPIGWLAIIFVLAEHRHWSNSGTISWWVYKRYLSVLPVPMAFGLAFALCTRKLLRTNLVKTRKTYVPSPQSTSPPPI